MSRSFAIILRELRVATPDPDNPDKMLTQERVAQIIEINIESYRRYEQDRRIPHPIIRRQLIKLFPKLATPE